MRQLMGQTNLIKVTPTITAGAYAAGDAVGGLLTFTILGAGGGGIVTGMSVTDKASANAELDLVLFNAPFTATSDNAPFDVSDADLLNCIGYVKVYASGYANFTDNSVGLVTGVGLAFKTATGALYGQLVTRSAPTYASTSDLQVTLHTLQD